MNYKLNGQKSIYDIVNKEKLDNLYHFYKIAMDLKGWQTYSDINLKFNNQIICVRK